MYEPSDLYTSLNASHPRLVPPTQIHRRIMPACHGQVKLHVCIQRVMLQHIQLVPSAGGVLGPELAQGAAFIIIMQ